MTVVTGGNFYSSNQRTAASMTAGATSFGDDLRVRSKGISFPQAVFAAVLRSYVAVAK
jgi:hypothetical protein